MDGPTTYYMIDTLPGQAMLSAPLGVSLLRVLVVDDDPSVRALLRVVLPLAGPYEVIGEANNGRSAVEAAIRDHPDIVVLDHMMPVQEGASAAFDLKYLAPETDIVFFSAYTDAVDPGSKMWEASVTLGCEIVPKGDTSLLEEALNRVVAKRSRAP